MIGNPAEKNFFDSIFIQLIGIIKEEMNGSRSDFYCLKILTDTTPGYCRAPKFHLVTAKKRMTVRF